MQSPSRPLAPAALPAMVPSRAPVVGAPVVRAPALARVVAAARLSACLLLFPLVAVFAGMDSVGASEMRVKRVLRRVAALADSTCTAMLAATNQCKPLHPSDMSAQLRVVECNGGSWRKAGLSKYVASTAAEPVACECELKTASCARARKARRSCTGMRLNATASCSSSVVCTHIKVSMTC